MKTYIYHISEHCYIILKFKNALIPKNSAQYSQKNPQNVHFPLVKQQIIILSQS